MTELPTDASLSGAVSIEPMTEEHLDAVIDIERASAPHPWTRGIFLDELAHPESRRYFVASLTKADLATGSSPLEKVVGFAGLLIQVGEAHVTNVAVRPTVRRNAVGTRLVLALMHGATEARAEAATLEVRASNIGAQRLYHRFGFVPSGVRPRYYQDREDAVIMWADDLQGERMQDRLAAIGLRLDTGVRLDTAMEGL